MPAFTSIIAGISAASGLMGVSDARKAEKRQAANQKQQATTARERAALEAQGTATERADVVLGATPTGATTAAIKKKLLGSGSSNTKVGGLFGSGTNIGGL